MQALIYALLPSIFLLDFLRVEFSVPRALLFMPELLSGVAFLLIMVELARSGRLQMPGRYVLLTGILFISLLFGLVIAEATTGPLVGGIRLYGKYFIFFLLPIVFRVSEQQLRLQLAAVAAFLVLQLPVTLLQRFVFYWGESGDEARGTLSTGSMTAIVLMFGLSVVVGMYHHGYLSRTKAALLGLCMLIPPTMAEAKGAFVLLPLAILVPVLFAPASGPGRPMRVALSALVCVVSLGLFTTLYNSVESTYTRTNDASYHSSLLEFFRDPDLLLHYLAPQLSGATHTDRVGRLDGVAAPIAEFWGDPQRMVSGLGVGALSNAPFSYFAVDQHRNIVDQQGYNVSFALLLWEFGLFGTFLLVSGYIMLWRDSRRLAQHRSLEGALALGWLAVIPVLMGAMFWKNVFSNNTVMYLFVYFSGVVIAAIYRQAKLPARDSVFVQSPTPDSVDPVAPTRMPGILNVGASSRSA